MPGALCQPGGGRESPEGAQHPRFLLQKRSWSLNPSPSPAGEGNLQNREAGGREGLGTRVGPSSRKGLAGRHEGPRVRWGKESCLAPRGANDTAQT